MKKVILAIIMILAVVGLTACNKSSPTVNQSWAKNENMTYNIYDSQLNSTKIGDARFITKTNLTDEDKKDLDDDMKKYANGANTKVTVNTTVSEKFDINAVYYTNVYRILTSVRRYHDLENNKNDYVLKAYHSANYYYYTITYPNDEKKATKSGKLKVGKTGYTEHEFLYFYVRCFDFSNVPSSIKVADPFTDSVYQLSCTAADKTSVATETSELGTLACNTVLINKSETPIGKGILVCYVPDESPYNSYGEGSMIKSKKMPTKIVENNLTYILSSFTATGNAQ